MKIYNLVLSIMFMVLGFLYADQHVSMQDEINKNKINATGYCEIGYREIDCEIIGPEDSYADLVFVKVPCTGNQDAACEYPISTKKYHQYLTNHELNKKVVELEWRLDNPKQK